MTWPPAEHSGTVIATNVGGDSEAFEFSYTSIRPTPPEWKTHRPGTLEPAAGATEPTIAVTQNRLAIAYRETFAGAQTIKLARAQVANPESDDDWATSAIVDLGTAASINDLEVIDGRLAVAYSLGGNVTLSRAIVDEPMGPVDWESHQVTSGRNVDFGITLLPYSAGTAIVYIDDTDIATRVAVSGSTSPTTMGDWVDYQLAESSNLFFTTPALAEKNGRLATLYQNHALDQTFLMRAGVPVPMSVATWTTHGIFNPASLGSGVGTQLGVSGDQFVALAETWNPSTEEIILSWSIVPEPEDLTDWQHQPLPSPNVNVTPSRIRMIDGRPIALYTRFLPPFGAATGLGVSRVIPPVPGQTAWDHTVAYESEPPMSVRPGQSGDAASLNDRIWIVHSDFGAASIFLTQSLAPW